MRTQFIAFILAREKMRLNRNLLKRGPFSKDPILAAHHFCNVNREHDAVTKWVHNNVRVPLARAGRNVLVKNLLVARIFNDPEPLAELIPVTDYNMAKAIMRQRRELGQRVMRGAYMMPSKGKISLGKPAGDYWLDVVKDAMVHDFTTDTRLEAIAAKLITVDGIGDFLANQVVTDLRYVPGDNNYDDWGFFVLAGPGTRRGLNRYFERKLDTGKADFSKELLEVRYDLLGNVPGPFAQYFLDPNNLSNCFCEFDKYCRAQEQAAAGKPITFRKYHGNPNP